MLELSLIWRQLLLLAVLLGISAEAIAQSNTSSMDAELRAVQKQLDELRERYGTQGPFHDVIFNDSERSEERLTFPELSDSRVDIPKPPAEKPPATKPAANATAAKKEEKEFPTVKVTGFFQADAGWFHQDEANIAALTSMGVPGDIQDGADFRRARLAATGDVWDNVGYMVEFDFAFPGRPSFMDVWLELKDVGGGNLRIGQFRQPFGMDGLTSVRELTFLERGLPFAFLPFRQIGAMYFGHSEQEQMTWAVSGFRFPTDPFGGNVGDNGGYGMSGRLTGLLVDNGDSEVVHIGGGFSFIDPSIDQVRYANQPEFFVSETGGAGLVIAGMLSIVPPFVDTGLIPANNVQLYNAELAFSQGSLHGQSEVYFASVDQMGGPRSTFHGAYAQLAYILTGEARPYNRKAGVLGRIDPHCPFGKGMGAWEIATRVSYLDLNEENVQGGQLTDLTVGLNWYLNKYTKLQLNYIHAFLNSSSAVYGPIVRDSNADIFAVRAQLDF